MTISDELANKFVTALKAGASLSIQKVTFEIQDEWRFLLVLVEVLPETTDGELRDFLELAQQLAERMIPHRYGDYSWMVNVIVAEKVKESVFGGDLDSPHSGLI